MRTAVKALKGSHLLPLREALGGPVLPMEVPGSPDWELAWEVHTLAAMEAAAAHLALAAGLAAVVALAATQEGQAEVDVGDGLAETVAHRMKAQDSAKVVAHISCPQQHLTWTTGPQTKDLVL
ncbi:g6814 [Coccomyxa viridis]|uniref:G6814 protein n=1 Tax=Coccomyxa viridis TaxID=1274662 RepID=A0ABP1FYM8_9CHLO